MSDRDEFEKWHSQNFGRRATEVGYETDICWQAWQAARAQGGGETPIVWINPDNIKRTMIASPGETTEVSAYREGEFTFPLYTQLTPSVPDSYLESLAQKAEDSDITFESVYDPGHDSPIQHDSDISERVADWIRAQKIGAATPHPAPNWIACSDRLPTEADADSEGNVWFCWPDGDMWLSHYKKLQLPYHSGNHWMPTNLKRPAPPEGAE